VIILWQAEDWSECTFGQRPAPVAGGYYLLETASASVDPEEKEIGYEWVSEYYLPVMSLTPPCLLAIIMFARQISNSALDTGEKRKDLIYNRCHRKIQLEICTKYTLHLMCMYRINLSKFLIIYPNLPAKVASHTTYLFTYSFLAWAAVLKKVSQGGDLSLVLLVRGACIFIMSSTPPIHHTDHNHSGTSCNASKEN
jgi:hypothetical protein